MKSDHEEWYEFECPVYHVDMDMFDMPFPGDVMECCPYCDGRHTLSTETGTAYRGRIDCTGDVECIDEEWSKRSRPVKGDEE